MSRSRNSRHTSKARRGHELWKPGPCSGDPISPENKRIARQQSRAIRRARLADEVAEGEQERLADEALPPWCTCEFCVPGGTGEQTGGVPDYIRRREDK